MLKGSSLPLSLFPPPSPCRFSFCSFTPTIGQSTDVSGLVLVAASQSPGSKLALLWLSYMLHFRNEMSSPGSCLQQLVHTLWHYLGKWQKLKQAEPCWRKQGNPCKSCPVLGPILSVFASCPWLGEQLHTWSRFSASLSSESMEQEVMD